MIQPFNIVLKRFVHFQIVLNPSLFIPSFSSLSIHIIIMIQLLLFSLLIFYFLWLFISLIYTNIEYPKDLVFIMASNTSKLTTPLTDPVRCWPSGVPQGASVVAAGVATFVALAKCGSVNPRLRAILSLSAAGITSTTITTQTILENPIGFNRLMWGISEYRRTNQWPSVDLAYQQSEAKLKEFAASQIKSLSSAEQVSIESAAKVAGSPTTTTTTNSFLPSSDGVSDLLIKFYENLFRDVMQFLQPALVQGHFDDLVGQRMFLEFILFMSCIFVGILFIIFIFSLIFVFNKDKIIKLYKNKFIIFFIKYEAFITKITLFIIPIFILMGLFSIGNGLYWLLTHPIPYESLGVDLHQFVSSEQNLICLSLSYNNNLNK